MAGLPTGTAIGNQATIVFDQNAAISTTVWRNILDGDSPTSYVHQLPGYQFRPRFPVEWSGDDMGSGVQDYTVYVSANGGPYTPWIDQTTETLRDFVGEPGNSYSFYSIARDRVGNIEEPKTVSETSTVVLRDDEPPSVTLAASANSIWPSNGAMTEVVFTGGAADAFSGLDIENLRFSVTDEYGLIESEGPVRVDSGGNIVFRVSLQASRRGHDLDGRLYSVVLIVKDYAGNAASAAATVRVLNDARK